MVVYKESQEKVKKDPDLSEWTGTWRDGRPINPLGSMPENSLTGEAFLSMNLDYSSDQHSNSFDDDYIYLFFRDIIHG